MASHRLAPRPSSPAMDAPSARRRRPAGAPLCAAALACLLAVGPVAADPAAPRWGAGTAPIAATAVAAASGTATPSTRAGAASTATPLPELVARVLARDPQVRVAQGAYGIAFERLRQTRSRMWPVAGLSVTRGDSRDIEFGFDVDRRVERSEAVLRWNAYNGGRDAAEIAAAEIELDAATEDLRSAHEDVAERLSNAYLELLRLELLLPYSLARLETVRDLVEQARRQSELGRIAESDFEQASAALSDAELEHERVLADRDAARDQLSVLAGEEIGRATPAGLPMFSEVALPADTPATEAVPASLRADRLRARAARERVLTVAESALAPRLDVEARYRLSDKTSPPVTTELKTGWTVGLRWEMPLGGETLARRNETERRAEALAAQAEQREQVLEAELALLAPRIANAQRALKRLERQIAQYARLFSAGELQFEAGRRGVFQLIQLRDARYAAEARRSEQARALAADRLRQLSLEGVLLTAFGVPTVITPPQPSLLPAAN